LELRVDNTKTGEKFLRIAYQLRVLFNNLLCQKLKKINSTSFTSLNFLPEISDPEIEEKLPKYLKKIRRESQQTDLCCSAFDLSQKLAEFLEAPINYSLTQIKQSEFDILFNWETFPEQESKEEQLPAPKPPPKKKGGVLITATLRYGSIKDQSAAPGSSLAGFLPHMKKLWTCPLCSKAFLFGAEEADGHLQTCEEEQRKQANRDRRKKKSRKKEN